ncbi:cysteine--tRNA ligase [Thorsellia anophelis]|uniref:Cysteine--tRNA ligase n=1 Tax=Thorsellia anophelis DSM 18579 TaxID=1123402 RepID=A0A1I0AHQ9_9GAMM|nr:cysteine--tRNA ligase [Thorsellia anophelis]SES93385.1 cysteinyl-tRNA synthetase [Thorsellia anophelis DSM 18579]
MTQVDDSPLYIFNTLSREKSEFKPIKAGQVDMYVCGVTVYDNCHIGHGRTFSTFDTVVRYLRYIGYQVNFIRNITDIDDKIINRANENQESWTSLVERMITKMHADFSALNILPADVEPRATDHISEIIEITRKLIERGHAYVASSGDVLFSVTSFSEYGKLSKQNLDNLLAGARVGIKESKRNPMDFVLWKSAKPNEPSWPSPWGEGRPGWHIECSAMNAKQLGTHFDIHGGGSDLMFPHHENEIAQSRCAHDGPYVNYWMHSGMLMIDHEKMSKSLNNFFTIEEVLEQYDGETIRYFLLSGHYRSQLNFSHDNLTQSRSALERLYNALRDTDESVEASGAEDFVVRFKAAMNDDFNTPEAYAVLFDLAKEINRLKADNTKDEQGSTINQLAARLRELGQILGILTQPVNVFFQQKTGAFVQKVNHKDADDEVLLIESLIAKRQAARAAKEWALADEARNALTEMGIELEDGSNGTTWRRK